MNKVCLLTWLFGQLARNRMAFSAPASLNSRSIVQRIACFNRCAARQSGLSPCGEDAAVCRALECVRGRRLLLVYRSVAVCSNARMIDSAGSLRSVSRWFPRQSWRVRCSRGRCTRRQSARVRHRSTSLQCFGISLRLLLQANSLPTMSHRSISSRYSAAEMEQRSVANGASRFRCRCCCVASTQKSCLPGSLGLAAENVD